MVDENQWHLPKDEDEEEEELDDSVRRRSQVLLIVRADTTLGIQKRERCRPLRNRGQPVNAYGTPFNKL